MWFTIGTDEAVNAKVGIVGLVAEMATVSPVGASLVVDFVQTLIAPIPDEATGQRRLVEEYLGVVGYRAVRIAHGMAVFAHDQWSVIVAAVFGPLCPSHDVVDRCVHGAYDIGDQTLTSTRGLEHS